MRTVLHSLRVLLLSSVFCCYLPFINIYSWKTGKSLDFGYGSDFLNIILKAQAKQKLTSETILN
jgi:hypothetical protein